MTAWATRSLRRLRHPAVLPFPGVHTGCDTASRSKPGQAVETGRLVIANGSRSALPDFTTAYPRLVVFNVTARPEVLAQRLATRGRETEDEIRQRLARISLEVTGDYHVVTIDNSDSLEVSAQAFIAALHELYCGTHFA